MRIGIVCYPTFGGSGVVATELGIGLAKRGHQVHFITYKRPARLSHFYTNIYYHEVNALDYPLFEYTPYDTTLASKLIDVIKFENRPAACSLCNPPCHYSLYRKKYIGHQRNQNTGSHYLAWY